MRQRGFSMTELVLVIIVTGILAVVVVPVFNGAGEFRARGYSDEVLSAARYAQKLAVARGVAVRLTLDPAAGYRLLTQSDPNIAAFDTPLLLPGRSESDARAPPAGTALPDMDIDFFPNGSSSGGNFTIEYDGEVRNFAVNAATGYVEKT